jgi:putative ABC transport system substrate-binding protein
MAMIKVIATVLLIAAGMLVGVPFAAAEQAPRHPRIGVLWPSLVDQWDKAFLAGLADNGYNAGTNAIVDIRATGGEVSSAPSLAEELIALEPDVIFAVTGVLAKAVLAGENKLRKQIPIVVITQDPVAEGVVDNVTRPGGNVTGLAVVSAPGELMTKHLQLLHEMLPGMKEVGCLIDTSWLEFSVLTKKALERAGPQIGVRIRSVDVGVPDDIDRALTEVLKRRVDAVIVPLTPMFLATRTRIINFAAKHRLPAAYGEEVFVYDGGLVSYGNSVSDRYRRTASVVAKILKGAKPTEIPVDYNATFRLVVNQRAAKAIGLRIPQSVLIQANEVLK